MRQRPIDRIGSVRRHVAGTQALVGPCQSSGGHATARTVPVERAPVPELGDQGATLRVLRRVRREQLRTCERVRSRGLGARNVPVGILDGFSAQSPNNRLECGASDLERLHVRITIDDAKPLIRRIICGSNEHRGRDPRRVASDVLRSHEELGDRSDG